MHKIEQLQITEDFTTTVEITGPENARECIVFSHGFGVGRDSRGMFTDVVTELSQNYRCIQFDYTRVLDNGDSQVDSFNLMRATLATVVETHEGEVTHVVAHSMGCLLACEQSGHFVKQLYLAPSYEPLAGRLLDYFKQKPGTVFDSQGNIAASRSDGSTTHIRQTFFQDLDQVVPLDWYCNGLGDVMVVEALQDEVIDNYDSGWDALPHFSRVSIPGDHNFQPPHRQLLVQIVTDYLET